MAILPLNIDTYTFPNFTYLPFSVLYPTLTLYIVVPVSKGSVVRISFLLEDVNEFSLSCLCVCVRACVWVCVHVYSKVEKKRCLRQEKRHLNN